MIELQHRLPEPAVLRDYLRQNPNGFWSDPTFQLIRLAIRHQLNLEQAGLCVYCECLLNKEDGHVEHIKSKDVYPQLTFAYNNVAHSCDGPNHCGHLKQNHVLPVEPRSGCNRFFALMAQDGRLVPIEAFIEGIPFRWVLRLCM